MGNVKQRERISLSRREFLRIAGMTGVGLVAAACALVAFAGYLRFREEGARRGLAWALAWYALALSAGEYALCFAGMIFAYVSYRRRQRLQKKDQERKP